MPISWNEIRHNAIGFAKEWAGETREEAEAKSFWDEFFGVFGIRRRTVASFEEPVKRITGDYGFIDLFWPGILISPAANISPYLIEGNDTVVLSRSMPISTEVPQLVFGSKATDGGNLIFAPGEAALFIRKWPAAKQFIRPYVSADDFINGLERHCLWLRDANADDLGAIPGVMARIAAVRDFRLASKKAPTRGKASEPSVFAELRQPAKRFLAIPKTSSERRKYIPIAFLPPETIVASEIYFCEGAEPFHFGILSSTMHMAWVRQICGRLESRYRYSNSLVYNNFPWPNVPASKRNKVEEKAQAVLAARDPHLPPNGTATLADIYDPLRMPPALVHAHAGLDRAVEQCYRSEPFRSDRERVEYLFSLYEKSTAPLLPVAPRSRTRRSQSRQRQ